MHRILFDPIRNPHEIPSQNPVQKQTSRVGPFPFPGPSRGHRLSPGRRHVAPETLNGNVPGFPGLILQALTQNLLEQFKDG